MTVRVYKPLRIWLPAVRAGSGADVFVQRLADGLEGLGHEPIVQWFPLRYELMPWALRSVAAPPGVDVIHASSWQAFAFKRDGLPLVVTEHHYVDDPAFDPYRTTAQRLYHRYWIGQCLRRSYEAASAIVAVSGHTAQAMQRRLHRHIDVIHNWIDTDIFSPAAQPRQRQPGDKFRYLFVGNPSIRKGYDILQPLARRLGEGYELNCLGGLRSASRMHRTAAGEIRFLGRVEPHAMPDVYRSVDAIVIPTRYEAFGYVALEAMACGLPVVGFDSSGTAEVCRNGETALLVSIGDIDGLLSAIERLSATPDLCAALGSKGRIRAESEFGQSLNISKYARLYDELIRR